MDKIFTISFRKLNPAAIIPSFKTFGAVAMDLHTIGERGGPAKDVVIPPQTTVVTRTGLVLERCPAGVHGEIVLRSSTAIKYPGLILANETGIIDEDYCGPEDEIFIMLRNLHNYDTYKIGLGERIAQLLLRETCRPFITELPYETRLHNGDRPTRPSRGGLGSTG